jgi:hypothetical protein
VCVCVCVCVSVCLCARACLCVCMCVLSSYDKFEAYSFDMLVVLQNESAQSIQLYN